MAIVVACPGCGAKLSADERMIGRTTACPKCGTKVAIEPPATPPPSARGSGAGSAVLAAIVIAVAAFGILFVVGAVALGAIFYVGRSTAVVVATPTPAPPLAPPTMVAVPPGQVVPIVAPPVAGVPLAAPGSPIMVVVDDSRWLPLPENPHRLLAKFPTEPAPFDPLEASLAGEGEGADLAREFAAEIMKSAETVAYRAQDGETTYSVSAMAFDMTSVPTEEYLDRLGSMIELPQPGFSKRKDARLTLEAPSELSLPQSTFPAYQAWLESDDAKRIVRVVPVGKVIATLQVEGPKTLSDDDPVAKAFLDSFGLMDKAFAVASFELGDVAETSPEGGTPTPPAAAPGTPIRLRSLPKTPATEEWKEFAGMPLGYRVSLPTAEVVRPSVEGAFDPPADETARQRIEELKARMVAVVASSEMMAVEQEGRRFLVFAIEIDPTGLEWYDVADKVGIGLDGWIGALYPSPNDSQGYVESDDAPPRGTARQIFEVRDHPDGLSALYLRRFVGQYGFVLVCESDEPLAADDPVARRFFDSLVAPPDAKLP